MWSDLTRTIDHFRVLLHYGAYRRREKLPARELLQFREKLLGAQLDFFARRSPFYRALGKRRLEELPIMDKKQVRAEFDRLVTDPRVHLEDVEHYMYGGGRATGLYLRRYAVLATSGTSGLRGVTLHDRRMLTANYANVARGHRAKMRRKKPRVLNLLSDDPSVVSSFYSSYFNPGVDQFSVSAHQDLDQIAPRLNEIDPDVLNTYPSAALALARRQRNGTVKIQPASMVLGGETLSPAAAGELRSAFGCEIQPVYGTTEAGYLAVPCSKGQMHVAEDFVHLEVLDDRDRFVPAGELGDSVLVTALWNRILPIVRYRLDDRVRISAEPCACGSPHRMIVEIAGRSSDKFPLPAAGGGAHVEVTSWLPATDLAMHGHPAILGAQLFLIGDHRVRAQLVLERTAPRDEVFAAARSRLEQLFASKGVDLAAIALEITEVPDLERNPKTGKVVTFLSVAEK